MACSLVLLDISSETPEATKAKSAIASSKIGLYDPKELSGSSAGAASSATASGEGGGSAGSKRKAGAAASATKVATKKR